MPCRVLVLLLRDHQQVLSRTRKGRFNLSVNHDNAIIVFSYTGYIAQEVNVNKRAVINVSLRSDSKQLSEVVVTSLGIKRQKRTIAYSIQEIDGSKFTQARETNVANSLKGRVAGVQINSSSAGPGGSVYIAIRRNSSLSGNNQSLIVVDGIPVNNDNLQQASYLGGRDYGDGIKCHCKDL